jgi:hypothetical protein
MSLQLTSYIYEGVFVYARLQIHIDYYITTTKEQKLETDSKLLSYLKLNRKDSV